MRETPVKLLAVGDESSTTDDACGSKLVIQIHSERYWSASVRRWLIALNRSFFFDGKSGEQAIELRHNAGKLTLT
jgi:hypothetical protein